MPDPSAVLHVLTLVLQIYAQILQMCGKSWLKCHNEQNTTAVKLYSNNQTFPYFLLLDAVSAPIQSPQNNGVFGLLRRQGRYNQSLCKDGAHTSFSVKLIIY